MSTMVRMTDLLKKRKEQVEDKKPQPAVEKEGPRIEEPEEPRIAEKEAASFKERPFKEKPVEPAAVEPEKEKSAAEPLLQFSDMLLGRAKESKEAIAHKFMRASIPDKEEAKKLYFEAIEFAVEIFNAYKNNRPLDKEDIINIGNKIVNNIMADSLGLLELFHELDPPLEFHRYYNAVNVTILSVAIGMVFKYNKSVLLELGVVGLLHDLDLAKNKDVINMPKKLTEEELKEIQKHSANIAAFVDKNFDFKKEVAGGVLQHHERKNGQGYPSGLTESKIQDLAMIVGLADTYEAMTHSRPYKEKLRPHQAILNIIGFGKELFSNDVIKALAACVGLYPVGSLVELNTGEIGKILVTNPSTPLRPVVSILVDADGNKCKEARTIDLQEAPSLYIKQVVEREDANTNKSRH